jgi:hypothetical protein
MSTPSRDVVVLFVFLNAISVSLENQISYQVGTWFWIFPFGNESFEAPLIIIVYFSWFIRFPLSKILVQKVEN